MIYVMPLLDAKDSPSEMKVVIKIDAI